MVKDLGSPGPFGLHKAYITQLLLAPHSQFLKFSWGQITLPLLLMVPEFPLGVIMVKGNFKSLWLMASENTWLMALEFPLFEIINGKLMVNGFQISIING